MTLTKGNKIEMKATNQVWTLKGERGIGFNILVTDTDGETQNTWSELVWLEYMINTGKAKLI